MENEAKQYTSAQETAAVREELRAAGKWPEPEQFGTGRALLMRQRLALIAAGVVLEPISL